MWSCNFILEVSNLPSEFSVDIPLALVIGVRWVDCRL
jgi:hypothetical protein